MHLKRRIMILMRSETWSISWCTRTCFIFYIISVSMIIGDSVSECRLISPFIFYIISVSMIIGDSVSECRLISPIISILDLASC